MKKASRTGGYESGGRKLPKGWKARFLQRLARSWCVHDAANFAKVSYATAYRHKKKDERFRNRWHEILNVRYAERLEATARRRALNGWREPVFYQGEMTGSVRKFSDALTIFMLKANLPTKYFLEKLAREMAQGMTPEEYADAVLAVARRTGIVSEN